MQKAAIAVLLGALVGEFPLAGAADCPEVPAEYTDHAGPWDYRNPATREKVAGVESFHFSKETELLRKGTTGDNPVGDITYVLNKVPNHPRALLSYINLVEKLKMDQPPEARFGLECAFVRAKILAPNDPAPWALRGMHLNKIGRLDDAIAEMMQASALAPTNANVHYNLGLLYFSKKDYENARNHAKQAYELGFPLPGLKEKLVKAGQWEK